MSEFTGPVLVVEVGMSAQQLDDPGPDGPHDERRWLDTQTETQHTP